MTKVLTETLKVGDVIMPPAREVQLWMRRDLTARNLPENALHLTITGIEEGTPDKKGRWLLVRTLPTAEWCANNTNPSPAAAPFNFKARPKTPWQKIA